MGFKLSNLFFVEEDEPKKGSEIKQKVKDEPINDKKENLSKPDINVQNNRKSDSEVVSLAKEALIKAMENSNLEGYDYFEFKNSLKALESVISDEGTRYKSAYAAVMPMGVTGEKLVTTANHYIDILKNEEKKFLYALGLKSDNDVTGSEKRIMQIEEEIKIKMEEIEKINQYIEKLKNDKKVIIDSIEANKIKIETSKNGFYSAYGEMVKNIEKDIEKITTYIK